MTILLTVAIYFIVLLILSRLTSRHSDNDTFFRGNHRSPWYMVAFGMIGASISGITFVSVPGMVLKTDMTYLQMCLGFIPGYFAVAFLLLPIYYKYNLTTIYTYLARRLGRRSYKTGASFFLLSKMTGAAVRFYVVCIILQQFVLDPLHIPFPVTVVTMVGLIWLYTRRGGIRTLVWTDTFQTTCMFAALVLIIIQVMAALHLSVPEAMSAIAHDSHSRVFVMNDWVSRQNFWKQFVSGIFVVIVMTGLDQDMMQRSLTCRNISDSQKNIVTSTILQTVVIAMFLILGVLLYMFADVEGISGATGDKTFPAVATSGLLPASVGILFVIGLISCSYSAGGSALTALTTSFTIDILGTGGKSEDQVKTMRERVHLLMAVCMGVTIIIFNMINSTSAIDAVYKLASYTYGPILGMFTFGILTKRKVNDKFVPLAAIVAPVLCLILQLNSERWFGGYQFSYELLIINALFTIIGLWISSKK